MAEFLSGLYLLGPFLNAAPQNPFVFFSLVNLRITAQFLRQIYIFDIEKSQIHIVIEGFCTQNFTSVKVALFQRATCAGIQRPLILLKVLLHILQKRTFLQGFVCPATVVSVFLIGLPGGLCLEAKHLAIVQRRHPLLDDVTHSIRRAMQFLLSDGIGRPAIFQPKLDYHIVFVI